MTTSRSFVHVIGPRGSSLDYTLALAGILTSSTAHGLDRQGRAHGGSATSTTSGRNVSGGIFLGVSFLQSQLRRTPVELHVAYERDMPVDRGG